MVVSGSAVVAGSYSNVTRSRKWSNNSTEREKRHNGQMECRLRTSLLRSVIQLNQLIIDYCAEKNDFSLDLNQIILGGGITMADPCRCESHFEFPDHNSDEIQRLIEDNTLSWLHDDILR
ncbi:unnamed protein product [Clavelina lepadiformis]|uniref:Actin n=1 Tax=Clavelina lepadiformis TaxID=159417 RepID=A0ABP0GIW5_CLALP